MAGNSFGTAFRATTWGESHGEGIGVVIDGCPPGIRLGEETLLPMLRRRRPGKGPAASGRKEGDIPRILSGVFEGMTTGTPILILIENLDAKTEAYRDYKDLFRPGHGDYTYQAKFGIRDWRGGGRASARETAARVAAGAVARAVLAKEGMRVDAYTLELGGIRAETFDPEAVPLNPFFCPDPEAALRMERRVSEVRKAGDSIGGVVEIVCSSIPPGLGDPVFDKLDADIAKGLMSIGAVKGVEIGAGFGAAAMLGSENNDPITPEGFSSNHAGGILGGISNGDEIRIRVAVKPIPSIRKSQSTIDREGRPVTVSVHGRHDVSAIPRINVVCEAMVWMTLADHHLRQRGLRCDA